MSLQPQSTSDSNEANKVVIAEQPLAERLWPAPNLS